MTRYLGKHIFFQGAFMLSSVLFISASRPGWFLLLGLTNTFLGIYHFQPFSLVMTAQGLMLGILLAQAIYQGTLKERRKILAWKTICAFIVPGIAYIVLCKIIFPYRYEPFLDDYVSAVSAWKKNHTLLPYIQDFFPYIFQWLVYENYKDIPFFLHHGFALGVTMASLILSYLAFHFVKGPEPNRYLAVAGLTCFAFAFVYEPLFPERWDTFFLVLLLLLAIDRHRRISWIKWSLIVMMFSFAPKIMISLQQNNIKGRQRMARVKNTLIENKIDTQKIYFPDDPSGNYDLLLYFPISIRLIPLKQAEAALTTGDPLYLAFAHKQDTKAIQNLPAKVSLRLIVEFPEINASIYEMSRARSTTR